MMKVEIPITLDVTNYSYARPYIDATQGDAGTRYLKVFLTVAGAPVMMPDAATAVLNSLKPDKTYTETEGVISDNCIEFELKAQTLACLGSVVCDVQIISGENKRIFTTTPFEIRVHPSVISDEVIESKDEFSLLLSLLSNVDRLDSLAEKTELETIKTSLMKEISDLETQVGKIESKIIVDAAGNVTFAGNIYAKNGEEEVLTNKNAVQKAIDILKDDSMGDLKNLVKDTVIGNIIGAFAVNPYIEGVSGALSVQLDFPIIYDAYEVLVNDAPVSGRIAKGECFVSAPLLFKGDNVKLIFKKGDTVLMRAKTSQIKEGGSIIYGRLEIVNE